MLVHFVIFVFSQKELMIKNLQMGGAVSPVFVSGIVRGYDPICVINQS